MNVGERVQQDNGERGTVIRAAGATTLLVAWDSGIKETVQAGEVSKVGYVHMTATESRCPGIWQVFCRCGWRSLGHANQEAARTAGDQHLAEANR